jgi:hypothetical protein
MRFLFLLLFGYLVYRFLIKPILLDVRQNNPQFNRFDEMQDMINRMRQQQNGQHQNPRPKNNKAGSKNDGDYIDYEEVD